MLRGKSTLLSLGMTSLLALAACSPKNAGSSVTTASRVSVSSIEADSKMSSSEKAEALSELAARLVTPGSFMHAYDVAVRALAQDPANARAKFIKGVLAPQMELKGIVKRLAPLIAGHPQMHEGYKNLVRSLRETGEFDLQKFAFNGPSDIATERQAQEVIAQYTVRLDDLRKTLGEMKDTEFSLKLNAGAMAQGLQDNHCHILLRDGSYDFTQCDETSTIERTVNQADIEIMKQYVAFQQVYFTVANSYDVSGALNFSGEGKTKAEKYAGILRNSRAGILRKTNGLGVIPDLAKDAVIGARWAMAKQSELCATGSESDANRPKNLFAHGVCVKDDEQTESVLKTIELALQGSQVQIPFGGEQITVLPLQLLESPVQDLRSQPVVFNACEEVTSVGDGTLDGAFPTGDLNKALKLSATCRN